MIALRGAAILLPDRVAERATLFVEGSRVADVVAGMRSTADTTLDASDAIIAPGFIDVHVHGVEGFDTLDEDAPIGAIAENLVKYGVTAFCPTTVACGPRALGRVLATVERLREEPHGGARVLAAHLESNFINPDFAGAQPSLCLRRPPVPRGPGGPQVPARARQHDGTVTEILPSSNEGGDEQFTGEDILEAIEARAGATAIVTLAPELPYGLDLVRRLVGRGIRVSLGHSGASYDEAMAAFSAGVGHATHLFNRMSAFHHRDPGAVGAVLTRDDVDAELVCDGFHVHPGAARLALRLKSVERVIAVTDGTAGSGLAPGSHARLGGRCITVGERAAFLDDGTLAGSTLTMDGAFRQIVGAFGGSLVEAAHLCASTPARALGLVDQGSLAPGKLADFVVLDRDLRVRETWVGGRRMWPLEGGAEIPFANR